MRGAGHWFDIPLIAPTFGVVLLFSGSALATTFSYTTEDRQFAEQMAMHATAFAEKHGGRSPGSWADFESTIGYPVDIESYGLLPTKRYAVLDQPLMLPAPFEGSVLLLVTRRPFRDLKMEYGSFGVTRSLRQPGRYIVYRDASGEHRAKYVNEEFVQQAFWDAGVMPPAPDSEPLRRHEVEAHRRSIARWTITGTIATLLGMRGLRKFRRINNLK